MQTYSWTLTGKWTSCVHCYEAKAEQKTVSRVPIERSKVPGECLFLDISSIQELSFGQAKNWALILDDNTDFAWSFFIKKEHNLQSSAIALIQQLKSDGNIGKYIHCNNAGENKSLEKECARLSHGITFEYTAPGTPQQNGRLKSKFETLLGRVRSMFNAAHISDQKNIYGLWTKCANTATKNENMVVTARQPVPLHNMLFEKDPRYARHLKIFGKVGVVMDHRNKRRFEASSKQRLDLLLCWLPRK
jgi:hypothetical protein